MFKRICKLLSAVLVFALLLQMLPLQTLATNYRAGLSEKIDLPAISATDTVAAAIQDEIPAKRTAFSKEYKAGNGQNMVAVYPVAVHYETPTGWEEIDNTLKLTEGNYINTAGLWQVSLPQQLTKDNRISISKDGYTLRFGMSGELRLDDSVAVMSADAEPATKAEPMQTAQAQVSPKEILAADTPAYMAVMSQKNRSRLTYAEVYENTNVVYDLQGNKVKESIVIGKYDSDLVGYRYVLETGTLNPVLQEDGSIHFYDADNKSIVMVMEAPFLLDANAEQSNDIKVTLSGKEGTYYLTYTLPRQWLAQEERAWPVILDPAVAPCIRYYNIQDRTVGDVHPSTWNWAINEVGYFEPRGVERFYLQFNELPVLTSADVITAAQIQMYKPYTFTRSAAIEVHKVLETWNELDISWADQPLFSDTAEDYNIVKEEGNYIWDVTDIARGWYAGENTGMVFKATDQVEQARATNWYQFHSSDMGDDSIILTIYYRNNNGLESYWDYSSFSAGRAGTGYVNNYTGNLVWTRADLGFGGTRAAVAISHIYNANDTGTNTFGMGYGWRTNYNQRVYWVGGLGNYYAWEDGDGTEHYFYKEDGIYKDEDGLGLQLSTNGSGTSKYTITDKSGNVSSFDTNGRLTKITNNQATKSPVTITYTNTSDYFIYAVTDAVGRRYVFTYNDDDLLTDIKALSSTGQLTQVTYGYTDGLLTSITDKDGEAVTYAYNSEKLLTQVQDIDSYSLTVSYNTTVEGAVRRVEKICEFDGDTPGGELNFTYAQNQTTVEDYSGNRTVYQFNNWGNTVSIQDGEGRAQFAKYTTDADPDSKKGNQLTAASKLQNTVTNLFTDSSFETGLPWQSYPSSAHATISTTQAYHGNKSMEIDSEDETYLQGRSLAAIPGETYTFSAYIKLLSGTAQLGFDGVGRPSSEVLTPSNEWQRVQVSYTAPLQGNYANPCPVIALTGHGYIDCVQLEKAPTASRYNLIDNGDFTANSGWTGTGRATGDGISAPTETVSWLSGNAYKITGDPNTAKSVSQTVAVSGDEGDTFVLGGWAQGDGVPLENGKDQRDRAFGLKAVFHYTDDSTKEFTVSFNTDTPYWQYAALPLVAEKAYSSITVTAEYSYGMNTVCFDGIGLFKEQFSSSYAYDANGNVTSVKDLQEKTTTYEYQNNNLTKEILPDNTSMTYTYDTYHNVLTATSSTGLVYTFTYDTYGNNTSVSVAGEGKILTSSATYSDNGNALVTSTDTVGNVTTYRYDPDTNVLEWVEHPEDNDSDKTFYTYDEMYRVISTSLGEVLPYQEVSYTYTDDLLTEITTSSTSYTFAYGDFALPSSVKIGSQPLASYEYEDRTQRLTKLLYGNNDFIEYTYDEQGRVTKDTYEDGETVSYLYDNSGALATVIDSQSGISTTYYYDFIDRLAKYTEKGTNHSHSVEYGFDSKNNLSAQKEIINGVSRVTGYTYDEDNRLDTLTMEGHTVDYTYDALGRVVTQEVKNGEETVLTTTYTYYDPSDTTTSTQVKSIQQTAGDYSLTLSYTYDDNGNILTISDGANTLRYQYGEGNKLTREDDPVAGISTSYLYGENGNLFAELRRPYANSSGSTQTAYVEYGWDSDWGDMLTSYGDIYLSYDDIGNMLSDGTYSYTWEHGRELAEMASGDGTWAFTYDANGMRTKKVKTNSTGTVTDTYTYVYNGGQLAQMTRNGEVVDFFYDGEGRPAYLTYNNTTYYYVTNLQGDVIAILDSSGTVVVNYHYDAYGVLLQTGGTMAATLGMLNPLTYRGYVYDHETGLYYLQSRYYNPVIKRFISADTTAVLTADLMAISNKSLFAYCDNNPVVRVDTEGEFWNLISAAVGAAVGAVAGVAGQFVSDLTTSALKGEWTFSNWQTYAGAAVGGAAGGATLGLTGSPGLANAVSGFVTTGASMTLEKMTGVSDKSWGEIGANAIVDGCVSYGLGELPGFDTVTKGRNSMVAVYKSGLTKLRNSVASYMSAKVFGKGIVSTFVGGLPMDGYYGVKQFAYGPMKRDILQYLR